MIGRIRRRRKTAGGGFMRRTAALVLPVLAAFSLTAGGSVFGVPVETGSRVKPLWYSSRWTWTQSEETITPFADGLDVMPQTDGGADLGTPSLEWGALYSKDVPCRESDGVPAHTGPTETKKLAGVADLTNWFFRRDQSNHRDGRRRRNAHPEHSSGHPHRSVSDVCRSLRPGRRIHRYIRRGRLDRSVRSKGCFQRRVRSDWGIDTPLAFVDIRDRAASEVYTAAIGAGEAWTTDGEAGPRALVFECYGRKHRHFPDCL